MESRFFKVIQPKVAYKWIIHIKETLDTNSKKWIDAFSIRQVDLAELDSSLVMEHKFGTDVLKMLPTFLQLTISIDSTYHILAGFKYTTTIYWYKLMQTTGSQY